MRGLNKHIAVITGGGGGIGGAVADRLAEEGAAVVVTDVVPDAAERTAERINRSGGRALAIAVDVRDQTSLDGIPAAALKAFGAEPDLVVCNAGYQTFATIDQLNDQQWNDVLDTNAHGTFLTMRMAADSMRRTGVRGTITTIASIQARLGSLYYAHYSASKAAVLSLTKSFALALAPHGIRVNCVAPGVIETELWAKADREMAALRGVAPGVPKKERIAQVPLGRGGTPEDVAGAVAFLASDDAAYITGECLHVCGGDVML
jgi:NAD(P)-dependent dehydrogenase (short-subunit alcohol dehydrogenase family)